MTTRMSAPKWMRVAAGAFALLCLCGCRSPRRADIWEALGAGDVSRMRIQWFDMTARRDVMKRFLRGETDLFDDAMAARLLGAVRPGRPWYVVVGHGTHIQARAFSDEVAGDPEWRLSFTMKIIHEDSLETVAEGTVLPLELRLEELKPLVPLRPYEVGPAIAGYQGAYSDVTADTLTLNTPTACLASAVVFEALIANDWMEDSTQCDFIWLFPDSSGEEGLYTWDRVIDVEKRNDGLFPDCDLNRGLIDIRNLHVWIATM